MSTKSIIHILPPHESEKIAAGEVIERPANIVKELVENSIDAGSTDITITIEKAGKQLISIRDNGCGMSEQDAKLCFTRHATSKIVSVSDLSTISSFGFRGEALASIGSVSKIRLTTKQKDDQLGTEIIYQASKIEAHNPIARQTGTEITITDLFYNVPVRKKFLKQDETEWNQIQAVIHAFAFVYTDRSFTLIRDNKTVLSAPAVSKLADRITQIWGHNTAAQMIDLGSGGKTQEIRVTGALSIPTYWQYGRHKIFFFVNKRLVKNSDLSKALLKGYKNVLPPARFPAAIISLETEKSSIDVNIHPRKEEVRFTKPGRVANAVRDAVTHRLEQYVTERLGNGVQEVGPQVPLQTSSRAQMHLQTSYRTRSGTGIQASREDESLNTQPSGEKIDSLVETRACPELNHLDPGLRNISGQKFGINRKTSVERKNTQEAQLYPASPQTHSGKKTLGHRIEPGAGSGVRQEVERIQEKQAPIITDKKAESRIIGQLYKTYILIEQEGQLVIVDQHAAHERILYNQFVSRFEKREGTHLLFPELITLSPTEIETILSYEEFFQNQGIAFHQSGPTQIAITSSPPKIQSESLTELIHESLAFISEHNNLDAEDLRKKLNEHVHSHMACKSAIRAGDVLDHKQMSELVNQLMNTENRFICVHGRPTIWEIGKTDLEKRFRRIGK